MAKGRPRKGGIYLGLKPCDYSLISLQHVCNIPCSRILLQIPLLAPKNNFHVGNIQNFHRF